MTEQHHETTGPGVEEEPKKALIIRSVVCEGYTAQGFTARIPKDLIVLGLDVVSLSGHDDFVLFYAGNEGDTEKTHLALFLFARVGDKIPLEAGQHLAIKTFNGEFVCIFASIAEPVAIPEIKVAEGTEG